MKRLYLLSAALLLLSVSFAANDIVVKPPLKASEVLLPIGNSGKTISLLDLSRISVKDLQAYTGKKMKFAERLTFKLAQRQLQNSINSDGTVNSERLAKMLSKGSDVTSGFHVGGFLLGLFLWLIGVLIAYLINDDLKPARVKWAWIGAAISTVIWLIFAVI